MEKFELFEKVRIISKDLVGTIVDIGTLGGKVNYIVESDKEGPIPGGYGDRFPLFNCTEEDIEKVDKE